MPTTRPTPALQIRVIGPTDHAQVLIADITRLARKLLGPHHTYRTTTGTARRTGHIRVSLTATRKEDEST